MRPSCRNEKPGATGTILGLGTDLCDVARIAQATAGNGGDVLDALFTPAEIARARAGGNPSGDLAVCFAVKEAVVKALAAAGGRGSFWQDIEVTTGGGPPRVALRGRLDELATALGVQRILAAQGRCRRYAVACALALS